MPTIAAAVGNNEAVNAAVGNSKAVSNEALSVSSPPAADGFGAGIF
jgi:hypothetical protein